ncbi:unnamed protein product [Kuraishia capsulata CBS 1993]|uniref:Protein-serine/threonine kinase n=1 Tax=Kuraishia capsulata CBS 1993 TaxID=1382522 RepID=W6MIR8_9ASCO|nr:uncharacterized protein KUCA_T00002361001 [Kuraishia capsulata CBS 1993]CDK26389.1 unnamed protein product [Kuraishia capsulata CBS 1993]
MLRTSRIRLAKPRIPIGAHNVSSHGYDVGLSEITQNVHDLAPFPGYSLLLNPQHFYHNSIILTWAERTPHPVSLRQLAGFGKKLTKEKVISSANFVRTELPVRLALRIKDLQKLPFGVVNNFHIAQVYESYCHCFNMFRWKPRIETLEENDEFCVFLKKVLDDHLLILPHLMMGALECSILQSLPQAELDAFMSSMIRSRISRRVIIEQHISLSKNFREGAQEERPSDYIGDVFKQCSAIDNLTACKNTASNFLSSLFPHLQMPELIIEGDDVSFPFMPSHLNYIFGEITRNAYKSTIQAFVKRHENSTEDITKIKPPPIRVMIAQTKKDITFKFSDQGGGMKKENLPGVWSFGRSPELARKSLSNFHSLPGLNLTPRFPILESNATHEAISATSGSQSLLQQLGDMETRETSMKAKGSLSSLITRPFEFTLGISLPMCKVYTDYWNGDLNMYSLEGYGSDTYLRLRKLGSSQDKLQLDKA